MTRVIVMRKGNDGFDTPLHTAMMTPDQLRVMVERRNVVQIRVMVDEDIAQVVGDAKIVVTGANMVAIFRGGNQIGRASFSRDFITGKTRYSILEVSSGKDGKIRPKTAKHFHDPAEMIHWMDAERKAKRK